MAWDIDLAKEFKARDNKSIDEPVIGTVITTQPLSISILNNQVMLTSNLVYVSNSLRIIEGTCIVDGKTGTFTIDNSLKTGNRVLCIPTNNGQKYFIVEVIQ